MLVSTRTLTFFLMFIASISCCSKNNSGSSKGGVYTRWGRTDCPSGSAMLYKGFAAGTSWNGRGGGANVLCLPETPEWNKFTSGRSSGTGKIYGIEYEIWNDEPWPKSLMDVDVRCVVCQSTGRSTVLMIPGVRTCPKDWHTEYEGYLGSENDHEGRNSKNYICVDGSPEMYGSPRKSVDHGALYPVEAICGSLPCTAYSGGKELTCVVCSQ